MVESEYRLASDGEGLGGLIHGNSSLPHAGEVKVTLQRLWEKPENIPVVIDHGGHGGGDARMLNVLFGPVPGSEAETGDASKQGATEKDGALALVVGLLANESFKTGQFYNVKDLGLPLS